MMTLNSCIASTGRLVSCCGRVRPTAFDALPPSRMKFWLRARPPATENTG